MAAARKCFYHATRDAVTSCYQCHKPLCQQCVQQMPNGKFCSTLCSEKHQDYKAAFSDTKAKVEKVTHHGSMLRSIIALIVIIVVLIAVLKIGARMGIGVFKTILDFLPIKL